MPDVRFHDQLAAVPAAQWDALHDGSNPFISHAFLSGLEQHGCLRPQWGWTPSHVAIRDDDDKLVAAAPCYRKTNSHGEFVFDHAWAHAYAQLGLAYFPKLLAAVPYSPVTGSRLLAREPRGRAALLDAMTRECTNQGLSSAHVNFHAPAEAEACGDDWLQRLDVQYHWRNTAGWQDFDDFLAALDHKHRKNIRQERSKVARAGIGFRIVDGTQASEADLMAIHDLYLHTFARYANPAALTLPFLRHLTATMPRALVIILALHGQRVIAGALCLRGGDTLYGRYWGARETVRGLHFETCYYQGIDYCLGQGLGRFEPGAQGEHKLARGFLPVLVQSHHWLAQPSLRGALRDWCKQETAAVRRYAATLGQHSPFKDAETSDATTPDTSAD